MRLHGVFTENKVPPLLKLFAVVGIVILALICVRRQFQSARNVGLCTALDTRSLKASGYLHPKEQCSLIKYRTRQVVQCFSELTRRKSNATWHICFMGDSRIRQMYQMFNRYIPTDDLVVDGGMLFSDDARHDNSSVTSALHGFTVTFKWRPYPEDMMAADLLYWIENKETAPDVLVIGAMLWSMRNIRTKPFEAYSRHVTRIAQLLRQLSSFTTVIWWDQDNAKEKDLFFVEFVENVYIDGSRIIKYNTFVRKQLEGTSVIVWDSTHRIYDQFERACTVRYERNDGAWFWHCFEDMFHSGFLFVNRNIQQLWNHLCNPVLYQDSVR